MQLGMRAFSQGCWAAFIPVIGFVLVACNSSINQLVDAHQPVSARVVGLAIPSEATGRTFCHGVHIGDGKILTAGHCLRSLTGEVTVKCGLESSIFGQLEWFERHDEADIALIYLPEALKGPITKIDLSELGGVSSIWLATRYIQGIVPVLYQDAFTFQGRQKDNCLERGDSGAPAFVGFPDREKTPSAVGILISGQPDCPAWQTILRFSAVADWLTEVSRSKRSL